MAKGKKTGGRKKGTAKKATARREAEIAASGLTPLQFMFGVLRNPLSTEGDCRWAAEEAAPYCHPRMAAVAHTGNINFAQLSEAHLRDLLVDTLLGNEGFARQFFAVLAARRAAGLLPGPGSKGTH